MPYKTLLERASRCVVCRKLMGRPSDADLMKLKEIEREKNCEIEFLCEPCNKEFVKCWRELHGEDPTPTCVLGRLN